LFWVGEPMSAAGLAAMLDDPGYYAGLLSYHLKEMERAGVLYLVASRPSSGAQELLFFFSKGADFDRPIRSATESESTR
jgi:hypothetical protein